MKWILFVINKNIFKKNFISIKFKYILKIEKFVLSRYLTKDFLFCF